MIAIGDLNRNSKHKVCTRNFFCQQTNSNNILYLIFVIHCFVFVILPPAIAITLFYKLLVYGKSGQEKLSESRYCNRGIAFSNISF